VSARGRESTMSAHATLHGKTRRAALGAPVAIVGAGPYGLAIASHLRARGVEARVFGDPMASWLAMPGGMFLKSTLKATNISSPRGSHTLAEYCATHGQEALTGHHPVPISVFAQYGCWFAEQLVPYLERQQVVNVERQGGGYAVALDSGEEFAARAVVVASGHDPYAWIPQELLSAVAPERPSVAAALSHSGQHQDLSRFAGRDVAVIGGGQSALQTAALLHESDARVQVLVRRPEVLFGGRPANVDRQGLGTVRKPESPLGPGWSNVGFSYAPGLFRRFPARTRLWAVGRALGPSGAWWLRERVLGQLPVRTGEAVERISREGERIVLDLVTPEGPRTVTVDHLIAATGYRVDLDQLGFLAPALRGEVARTASAPRLGASYQSSVPGLFFAGLTAAPTFGPVMRFVCGTPAAARRISAALAR
jgi:thioredoxin reductase